MAAAIGQPLKIPVIVQSLGHDMYRAGMNEADAGFRPGLELMTYLDGNLSSNGLDDPALDVHSFLYPWWTGTHPSIGTPSHLCSATIESALNHYHRQLADAHIPFGSPHTCPTNSTSQLTHGIPPSTMTFRMFAPDADFTVRLQSESSTNFVIHYNMVHACEVGNVAEKEITMWRASGFNELFEASLKKECKQGAVEPEPGLGPGDEGGTKGKAKQPERFGPEVGEL